MSKSKKMVILSACKKNENSSAPNGEEGTSVYYVTDENGVPMTDENGENMTLTLSKDTVVVTDEHGRPLRDSEGNIITAVLETEVVSVTNAKGEAVLDENGVPKTSIQYKPNEDFDIPVTDENGEFVTDDKGNIVTTKTTVPASETKKVIDIPIIGPDGQPMTDENGSSMTYTQTSIVTPPVPGQNTANWSMTFGGSGNDKFVGVAPMSDGGYVGLMQSNSKDGSMADLAGDSRTPIPVLIRYNKEGKIEWKKAVSSNLGIIVTGVATDSQDNILFCGYSQAKNLGVEAKGEYDAILYKFSKKGEMLWVKSYAGSGVDGFENLAVGADDSIVLVGYSGSKDGDLAKFNRSDADSSSILVKYSKDGTLQFDIEVGKSQDTLNAVAVAPDGNIYVAGNFTSTEPDSPFKIVGRSDGGVMKFSPDGKLLWKQSYGDTQIENFNDIVVTPSGGCVVVGRSNSDNFKYNELVNQGGYDAIMLEYTADGNLGFKSSFKGFYDDAFTSIAATENGYVVVGYSNSSNRDFKPLGHRGNMDGFVITVDNRGTVTSAQGFGGSKKDQFSDVCITTGKEIIVCGLTNSNDGDLVGANYPQGNQNNSLGVIARFT